MNKKPKDFSDKLNLLTNSFIESLPDRVLKIQALHNDFLLDRDPIHLEEMHKEIHSLTGSCATFGLSHISDHTRIFEDYLKGILQTPPALIDEIDENLARNLDIISREVTKAINQREDKGRPEIEDIGHYLKTDKKLRIMAADKDENIREYISLILSQEGHEVITASSGKQAIDFYNSHKPDIVISGVVFDDISGYEIAREIKLDTTRFTPVIFITALKNNDELVQCIEAGGDDFLVKPINPVLMHTRIAAMDRIRAMHDSLLMYQNRMEEEMRFARHIFDAITDRSPGIIDGIDYWCRPSGHFSGDIFAYQINPEGNRLSILFGDLTGHGLTAAMGAVPSTDIFYTMVSRGFTIENIAMEINKKLHTLMPTGRFLACTLIQVDLDEGTSDIINASMPPVLIADKNTHITGQLTSDNIALGIMGENEFSPVTRKINNSDCRSLFLYSDGASELTNKDDEMLGDRAIRDMIDNVIPEKRLTTLQKKMVEFTRLSNAVDDISLLSLDYDRIEKAIRNMPSDVRITKQNKV